MSMTYLIIKTLNLKMKIERSYYLTTLPPHASHSKGLIKPAKASKGCSWVLLVTYLFLIKHDN